MSDWIILPVFLAFASSVWAFWKLRQAKAQIEEISRQLKEAAEDLRVRITPSEDAGDTR